MGRGHYLSRLALGRSAFEEDEGSDQAASHGTALDHRSASTSRDAQQYDPKGRPINPAIEEFNSDMRNAQNQVLELVGVVERKDQSDRLDETRYRYERTKRVALLVEENERGELLEYATVPFTYLSKRWARAFLQRIQIGYYDPSRSMADILASEFRNIWSGSVARFLATCVPAFGETVVRFLVKLPLIIGTEQFIGRSQSWAHRHRLKRQTHERINQFFSALFETLTIAIEVALLPMEFYATTQRLGLLPPLPLFPSIHFSLPRSTESFHHYAWKPLVGLPLIHTFTSPAMLMMLNKMTPGGTDKEETPLFVLLSSFQYPAINEDHTVSTYGRSRLKLPTDPIGWCLDKQWYLRQTILHWCGWNLVAHPRRSNLDDAIYDENTRLLAPGRQHELDGATLPTYRSTDLAHLPVKHLAKLIDSFLCRLMLLPLESLTLRAVAKTFLAFPPTPAGAVSASTFLYEPFGGSPLCRVVSSPASSEAWSALATYSSRLGLALALNAAVDTVLFFAFHASARHIGVRSFDWGRKGHVESAGEALSSRRDSASSTRSRTGESSLAGIGTDTGTGSQASAS